MMRIGLTGGIAAGKSLVAETFAELGAVVIDADLLAREAVAAGSPGLAAVKERFGSQVLHSDGTLNRAALAELVFTDDAARADLNAIIHPLVRAAAARAEAVAPPGAVVVHAIPLLVETGQHQAFDRVVVVDVSPQQQLSRLQLRDQLTPEQAQARLRAQALRQQRLAVADHVIDNSGSIEETRRQVAELWADFKG